MKGYRTITLNGLGVVVIALLEIGAEVGVAPELHAFLGPDVSKYVLLGVLLANVVLRTITTTPVGVRETDEMSDK